MLGAALDQLDPGWLTIDQLSRVLADHAVVDDGLDLATLVSLGNRIADGPPLVTELLPVVPDTLPNGAAVLRLGTRSGGAVRGRLRRPRGRTPAGPGRGRAGRPADQRPGPLSLNAARSRRGRYWPASRRLGDERGDRAALAAGEGDVAEQRVAAQGVDHRGDAVVATDPEVVALGDVVGEHHPAALAEAATAR